MDKSPLLEAGQRDGSITLPALQKLLQLAYSDTTDKQLEVGVFNTPALLCLAVSSLSVKTVYIFGVQDRCHTKLRMT